MIRDSNNDPERLLPEEVSYALNELVLTSVQGARNDDHPHYLNAAAASVSSNVYGDPLIDGVLQRLNVGETFDLADLHPAVVG